MVLHMKNPDLEMATHLAKLTYHFAAQSAVMSALLRVLNEEVPELKSKLIDMLERSIHPDGNVQAMIDEALDYVNATL
jgi:hypothetical protein